MNQYLFRRIAKVVIVIVSLGFISCSQGHDSEAVRKTVADYCQFDFDGSRLSGKTWKELESLIGYEEEPGWDRAVVVRGFKVSRVKVTRNTATAHVEYAVVGQLEGAEEFRPLQSASAQEVAESNITAVDVQLKKVNGKWKIADFIPFPRVSVQKMIEHLESLYAEERDESRRPTIRKTIGEIKKYAKS